MCDENTVISQVGTLSKGNPTTDSDRVKAPVVSASPMDSGKAQSYTSKLTGNLIEVDHLASANDISTSAPITSKMSCSNWTLTPSRETPDIFKRSGLVVRSPERSVSEEAGYFTPRTKHGEYETKRKRPQTDSAEKNPPKKNQKNDVVSRLERLVTKLCNSVNESSNTKKEIRDISSQMRSLVARLVSDKNNLEEKLKMQIGEKTYKVSNDGSCQTESVSAINRTPQHIENVIRPQMKDKSIQTEPYKTTTKNGQSEVDRINQLLDNSQGETLINVLSERWPGDVYKYTKTVRCNHIENISENGAVFIVEPGFNDNDNVTDPGLQSIEMDAQLKTLMKGIQMKHGDIARISTKENVRINNDCLSDSQRFIYVVALDIRSLGYAAIIGEILKGLETLKEMYTTDGSIPDLMYGTLIDKALGPLRKVLEYTGRRQKSHFEIYGNQRENKENKKSVKATNKNKWLPVKSKNRGESTILVTPNEGVTYADVLREMKKGVEPQKLGIQIRSVRSTDSGLIRINTVGGDRQKLEQLQAEIKETVGKSSKTEILHKEQTLIIRDLDDTIENEDVTKAILNEIGQDVKFRVVMSETKNRAGYRHAFVSIPMDSAPKLLCHRRINVGWSRCRIEELIKPRRCFRCLSFGHIAYKCDKPTMQSCMKCGGNGHTASLCKESPYCPECKEDGHRSDGMKCPFYRKLVEDLRRKRQQK